MLRRLITTLLRCMLLSAIVALAYRADGTATGESLEACRVAGLRREVRLQHGHMPENPDDARPPIAYFVVWRSLQAGRSCSSGRRSGAGSQPPVARDADLPESTPDATSYSSLTRHRAIKPSTVRM
jgi:hypothetical protein